MLHAGVFAAVPTPSRNDGSPDIERLEPLIDFLAAAGLDGVCIGGATGEYLAYDADQRPEMLRRVSKRSGGRLTLILGAGAESYGQVIRLVEAATGAGASAVLLPAPSYFPYDPDDLAEFATQAASRSPLPVLLYNIPQFNNDFGIDNALRLIESVPNIVGMKDSSGVRANLPLLRDAKKRFEMLFFAGNDEILLDALRHGADGAISGVASACPELVLAIYQLHRSGQMEQERQLQALLDEFCAAIGQFPVPWGIRWALEVRGFPTGSVRWPLSKRRQTQMGVFQHWFESWWPACAEKCSRFLTPTPCS